MKHSKWWGVHGLYRLEDIILLTLSLDESDGTQIVNLAVNVIEIAETLLYIDAARDE